MPFKKGQTPPGARPFKKGETGNPHGRPRKLPELDCLMAEILGNETKGKTAAEAILSTLRRKAMRGDIRAAEILLDRAYGKAKQVTEEIGEHKIRVTVVKKPDANLGG